MSEAEGLDEQLSDVKTGALLGAGGHAAGGLLSKLVPTAKGTQRLANEHAIKHLRPTPSVARNLGAKKLDEVAQAALDSGAIKAGRKVGTTADALGGLKASAYEDLKGALDKSDVTINPRDVAKNVEERVIAPLNVASGNKPIVDELKGQIKGLLAKHKGAISPKLLEEEKKAITDQINWGAGANKAKNVAQKSLARELRLASEEAMSKGDEKLGEAFKKAKGDYGNYKAGSKMAEMTRGLSNSGTGLMGQLYDAGALGLAGASILGSEDKAGALPGGLGLLAARALTRGRYHSTMAAPTGALARYLRNNPRTNASAEAIEQLIRQGGGVAARQGGSYNE